MWTNRIMKSILSQTIFHLSLGFRQMSALKSQCLKNMQQKGWFFIPLHHLLITRNVSGIQQLIDGGILNKKNTGCTIKRKQSTKAEQSFFTICGINRNSCTVLFIVFTRVFRNFQIIINDFLVQKEQRPNSYSSTWEE